MDEEEERLRPDRVLVEEVAVRPLAVDHPLRVRAVEIDIAVAAGSEEPTSRERARDEEEQRAGGRQGPASHRSRAPTATAARAHVSTSTAAASRLSPPTDQMEAITSFFPGRYAVSCSLRTPQLSACTVIVTADANASANVGNRNRSTAAGSPSARNGRATARKRGPGDPPPYGRK